MFRATQDLKIGKTRMGGSIVSALRSDHVVAQLFRYGANCGVVLACKLLLTWIFVLWMTPLAAYGLVHIATFFLSYGLHARKTFGTQFSFNNLRKYFVAVIGFKLLDYFVFSLLFTLLEIHAVICVLAASIAIMLLRFVVVRKVLRKKTAGNFKLDQGGVSSV